MSDFFADQPAPPEGGRPAGRATAPRGRRPRPLLLTVIVVGAVIVGFSLFAGIWTDKLWFSSLGYSKVFSTLIWTRVVLFTVFGGVMALIVGINLYLAFRLRPVFRPHSPEQANLERYREIVTPMRRVLLVAVSVVFGVFAGISATGKWRTFLLWNNREDFGKADPYFHKDIGFYVFSLPWMHFLIDFAMTAVFTALLLAAVVHYLYGGIRLQSASDRFSGAAVAQLSALFGLFLLLKGGDYWLDRFDLTSQTGSLITGMTYTRDHAVLPSKNILMFIAVICAVLFFANIVRRTWLLPGVGLALFAISAVLLGGVWPGPDAALPGQARRAGQGGAVHRQEHLGDAVGVRPRRHDGRRLRRAHDALAEPAAGRRGLAARHPPGRPVAGLLDLRPAPAGARLLQRAVGARRRPLQDRLAGARHGRGRP